MMNSPLTYRKLLIVFSQTVLIGLVYYITFLLVQNFKVEASLWGVFVETLPFVVITKLLLFYRFGLLRGWWRYSGLSDLLDLSYAAAVSSLIMYAGFVLILSSQYIPRSIIIVDFAFTILVTGGLRFAVRAYTEAVQMVTAGKRTLIVGVSPAGSSLARELGQNSELDYLPVGFVDDDEEKKGIKINGIKVLGSIADLPRLIPAFDVARVLIALPSAEGKQVERVVNTCRACKVDFKILPTIGERINGNGNGNHAGNRNGNHISEVRSVRVEDLLGRSPVKLESEAISRKLHGKVLFITGAGGSIGSELARQVARFGPKKVILYERSENDLFNVWTDLSARFPHLALVPVVGDILDVAMLRDTFSTYRPDSVFHAAAYKHVPLMERSCFQAVTNNIFGTYNVALIAKQYQVGDFVLISSDKAVNPTNIMGVTKRVAELIILGLQNQRTNFMAVRFGNVLGSNGSVLPTFERQIAAGGPITITHADAERYFMTIPEAVQLVLQAATMGRGGEIFVLDMGEAVRILDLAKNLIRLSGLEADRDIKIVYTGLRPGEKLFEELSLEGEYIRPTSHEKIRVLRSADVKFDQVGAWLHELSALVDSKNVHGIITRLKEIVPEYTPSKEMLSLCELDRHDIALTYKSKQADLWVGVRGVA